MLQRLAKKKEKVEINIIFLPSHLPYDPTSFPWTKRKAMKEIVINKQIQFKI